MKVTIWIEQTWNNCFTFVRKCVCLFDYLGNTLQIKRNILSRDQRCNGVVANLRGRTVITMQIICYSSQFACFYRRSARSLAHILRPIRIFNFAYLRVRYRAVNFRARCKLCRKHWFYGRSRRRFILGAWYSQSWTYSTLPTANHGIFQI